MPDRPTTIFAIVVVHVAIFLVQWAARRLVRLNNSAHYGIYLALLIVGFNCFGFGFPPWLVAAAVMLGLTLLLWGIRSSYPRHADARH